MFSFLIGPCNRSRYAVYLAVSVGVAFIVGAALGPTIPGLSWVVGGVLALLIAYIATIWRMTYVGISPRWLTDLWFIYPGPLLIWVPYLLATSKSVADQRQAPQSGDHAGGIYESRRHPFYPDRNRSPEDPSFVRGAWDTLRFLVVAVYLCVFIGFFVWFIVGVTTMDAPW